MKLVNLNLGDLEIAVLEALWASGEGDARTLHARLNKARGNSLSTMQSTLERLHRKGLLTREKVSHAYIYAPALSRDAVMGRLVDEALRRFHTGRLDGLIAAFAGYADRAEKQDLDQLERLIAERKAAMKKGKPS
ncbi:MAG: BlaI/MecI/CopY family transcriptional regulator [Sphingomonadales bacterium]|nr:BlaI/MecI/CopY family transcriptional regulator [Sphingomonadales bacterium]